MSYPTIPFIPSWDNTKTEQSNLIVTKFLPNAVEARAFKTKINTTNVTFAVSGNITNATEVDNFLRQRNGKPFKIEGSDELYHCTEWTVQILADNVNAFSATFEQVRSFAI